MQYEVGCVCDNVGIMGNFLNQILHPFTVIKSHDAKIFKFQILEILENEGFRYTKDIRQLETSLDANERHWI